MEILEQQIKELTAEIKHHEEQKAQSEEDLKASVDKVFVLREIISDLEGQIQLKNLNEHVNEERSQVKNNRSSFAFLKPYLKIFYTLGTSTLH